MGLGAADTCTGVERPERCVDEEAASSAAMALPFGAVERSAKSDDVG